jgi:crotonobetainyl-CoA:carnitine CoA-transferase CaiB-like acyl-CoA transferase
MTDLEKDPKYSSIDARATNSKELIAIMDQKFSTKPRDEWLKILQDEGCICTPIQSPIEVSNDPQAIANNYFVNVSHPVWGDIKMVGFPWDFSETPASWRYEAPEFGQHTEDILLEMGYSWDDISKLKEEHVIN